MASCHPTMKPTRFPLPTPLPQAGEGDAESLRDVSTVPLAHPAMPDSIWHPARRISWPLQPIGHAQIGRPPIERFDASFNPALAAIDHTLRVFRPEQSKNGH